MKYNDVFVFASINGHDPEKFLFDTGASINTVYPEAAKRFGLVSRSSRVSIDANGNRKSNPHTIADSVEFGPVVQTGVGFLISDPHRLANTDAIGVISINGLQGFTIDLDYPSQRLAITNERLDPESPTTMRYISYNHEMVHIPIEIGSADHWSTIWTLLDTGGSGNLRLDTEQSQIHTQIKLAKPFDTSVGSHNIPWVISAAPIIGSVRLGETIIDRLHATVNQKGNNIGMGIIRDFHIKIDGVSKLVSFERPDRARRVVWVEHLGMHQLFDDTTAIRPGFVIPGGLAKSAGITIHDVILQVDGKPPSDTIVGSAYWPIPAEATSVTVRVLRDGKEVDVVLPLGGIETEDD